MAKRKQSLEESKSNFAMMKNALIALFFFQYFIVNGIHAQNDEDKIDGADFSIKNLQCTTWQVIGTDANPYVIEFTGDKIIHYFDGSQIAVFDYYLSNEAEEIFNEKRLGKDTVGKHLVSKVNNWRGANTVTSDHIITRLDKNSLIIENVDRNIKTKFKRVS